MSFRAATQITSRRSAFATFKHQLLPLSSSLRQFHTTLPKMTVHNIATEAEFDETVKKYPVVLVDAFATWCGPCKAIAPLIVKMSEEERFKDVFFAKIDVDELPQLSQKLGITAMPTFVAFKDGKLVEEKVVGAKPNDIQALLASQL
ncbi:thioredoxin-like protein [Poronia punctata]|nr:thioredoxin-like protein [Poronia punctata]